MRTDLLLSGCAHFKMQFLKCAHFLKVTFCLEFNESPGSLKHPVRSPDMIQIIENHIITIIDAIEFRFAQQLNREADAFQRQFGLGKYSSRFRQEFIQFFILGRKMTDQQFFCP